MLRFLLAMVLVAIVAVLALGYLGRTRSTPVGGPGSAERPIGTAGEGPVDTDAARDRAAELGESTARAANRAAEVVNDAGLTAKIKSKMALDDLVRARNIDVTTTNGVVRLSGVVASAAERDRALQLARETEGVRSVSDDLRVTSTP